MSRSASLALLAGAMFVAPRASSADPIVLEAPMVAGQRFWLSQSWYINESPFTHALVPAWDFNWVHPNPLPSKSYTDHDFGMPVAASQDALVCLIDETTGCGGYGRCVVVLYGTETDLAACSAPGNFGKYAHLTEATVKEGQRVRAGQVVGFIGRSGRVWKNGKWTLLEHAGWGAHLHTHSQAVRDEVYQAPASYEHFPMRFENDANAFENTGGIRRIVVEGFSSPHVPPPFSSYSEWPLPFGSETDDGVHGFTSRNDSLWREAYARQGGSSLGQLPAADTYLATWYAPFVHWSTSESDIPESGDFADDGVPKNYYLLDLTNVQNGSGRLVYDALGGGHTVVVLSHAIGDYVVHHCADPNAPCGALMSGLGLPITDPYPSPDDIYSVRQDFMRGYVTHSLQTLATSVHGWGPDSASPGWTDPSESPEGTYSWLRSSSYALVEAYAHNGHAAGGTPFDNGGGSWAHRVYRGSGMAQRSVLLQDVCIRPPGSACNPSTNETGAIILNEPSPLDPPEIGGIPIRASNAAFVVSQGFWGTYKCLVDGDANAMGGVTLLGSPIENAHYQIVDDPCDLFPPASRFAQRFQKGRMWWEPMDASVHVHVNSWNDCATSHPSLTLASGCNLSVVPNPPGPEPTCDPQCGAGDSLCVDLHALNICGDVDGCSTWLQLSCAPGQVCLSTWCVSCGGANEPCCDGHQCDAGMVCSFTGQELGTCGSSPEVCDGEDNDGDDVVDNGDPEGGAFCSTGLPGVCGAGHRHCIGGSLVCVEDLQSMPELCGNGLDDDCNGFADDGCGSCAPGDFKDCYDGPANTLGVGACTSGKEQCWAGGIWSGVCGNEVTPSPEVCNGLDDNCDGVVDEGCGVCTPGTPQSCYSGPAGTAGVGQCLSGTRTCDASGQWPLQCPFEVVPASESCNGVDDNCDGIVDEGCGPCLGHVVSGEYAACVESSGRLLLRLSAISFQGTPLTDIEIQAGQWTMPLWFASPPPGYSWYLMPTIQWLQSNVGYVDVGSLSPALPAGLCPYITGAHRDPLRLGAPIKGSSPVGPYGNVPISGTSYQPGLAALLPDQTGTLPNPPYDTISIARDLVTGDWYPAATAAHDDMYGPQQFCSP